MVGSAAFFLAVGRLRLTPQHEVSHMQAQIARIAEHKLVVAGIRKNDAVLERAER